LNDHPTDPTPWANFPYNERWLSKNPRQRIINYVVKKKTKVVFLLIEKLQNSEPKVQHDDRKSKRRIRTIFLIPISSLRTKIGLSPNVAVFHRLCSSAVEI
jgi:hypothetical protein